MSEIQNLFLNLKKLRSKQGWTQLYVAKALNISIPAYSNIETGFTDVNLSRLVQLAKLHGVSIIKLFAGENLPDSNEIEQLKNLVIQRDQEVISLQKTVIKLLKK